MADVFVIVFVGHFHEPPSSLIPPPFNGAFHSFLWYGVSREGCRYARQGPSPPQPRGERPRRRGFAAESIISSSHPFPFIFAEPDIYDLKCSPPFF